MSKEEDPAREGRVPRAVEKLQSRSNIRSRSLVLDGTESQEMVQVLLSHASVVQAQLKVDRQRSRTMWLLASIVSVPCLLASGVLIANAMDRPETNLTALTEGSQEELDQLKITLDESRRSVDTLTMEKSDLEKLVGELQGQIASRDRQLADSGSLAVTNDALTKERDDLRRRLEETERSLQALRDSAAAATTTKSPAASSSSPRPRSPSNESGGG